MDSKHFQKMNPNRGETCGLCSKKNGIARFVKTSFNIVILYVIICSIAIVALFSNMLLGNSKEDLSAIKLAEKQKLSSYAQLDEGAKKLDNCSFIEFSTFFINGSENDENAVKRIGTCRSVNEKDNLYIDLNVLSNGFLEDAQIVIEGENFEYNATSIEDELINSIDKQEGKTIIRLNKLTAGTQKLILGEISSKINNIKDYSCAENKITLTGTHISNDNVLTKIDVTRKVTVDWYGETEVDSEVYVYDNEITYNYNNSEAQTVILYFAVDEIREELLLKNNYVEVEIPQLNNIDPESVMCINGGVAYEYDAATRIISIIIVFNYCSF